MTGTACAEEIIVTSPDVNLVNGGGGDDVIYVNPEVEVVYGGEGDDAIYGELPQTETGVALPGAEVPQFIIAPGRARRPVVRRIRHRGAVATISTACPNPPASCYGGLGSQALYGNSGDDKIFGERGDDNLYGEGGKDALYGGIGDDGTIQLDASNPGVFENDGSDLLSGGLGADTLDGNADNDIVRGDGTGDTIAGGADTDTLSFSTAVTPGFAGAVSDAGGTQIDNFPPDTDTDERGVYVRLDGTDACTTTEPDGTLKHYQACNTESDWGARYGGGRDQITATSFENIIGSPFADYIVGSDTANRIDAGGGADVVLAKDGADVIYGGADGDYIDGGGGSDTAYGRDGVANTTANNCTGVESKPAGDCSGTAKAVTERTRSLISVGYMITQPPVNPAWVSLYLTGSNSATDNVDVTYTVGNPDSVSFSRVAGAYFDTSASAASEGCTVATDGQGNGTSVTCSLPRALDAITLAGMGGADRLTISGFLETASPVLLGGQGGETLLQGANNTEDLLVDGPGVAGDTLKTLARDDAVINNEGADVLEGGYGNDLLVSAAVCNGDTINGAGGGITDGGKNNASWAQLKGSGVVADLAVLIGGNYYGKAGDEAGQNGPACSTGSLADLFNVIDLEGSNQDDALLGGGGDNDLLGHDGQDALTGRNGGDTLSSWKDSGTKDDDNCGGDNDLARVDSNDVWQGQDRSCDRHEYE
ncbi:MAG: calcium-binding protein [Solirubrobacterales bacterium]